MTKAIFPKVKTNVTSRCPNCVKGVHKKCSKVNCICKCQIEVTGATPDYIIC